MVQTLRLKKGIGREASKYKDLPGLHIFGGPGQVTGWQERGWERKHSCLRCGRWFQVSGSLPSSGRGVSPLEFHHSLRGYARSVLFVLDE